MSTAQRVPRTKEMDDEEPGAGKSPLQIAEVAFFTEDVAATADFYRRLLSREPAHASQGMATFVVGGAKIFIHETYVPGEGELPPENHVAFAVDDLEETCAALSAQGIEIEVAPREFYWGRSAYLRAPDGQLIELVEKTEGDGS